MKIGNPVDKPALPAQGTVAATEAAAKTAKTAQAGSASAAAGAAAAAATPDPSAKVELSSTASTLLSGSADFDAEKVARISDAIAAGTFKVNPEVIADKLISNAQELLTKVGS